MPKFETLDAYVASFPAHVRSNLQAARRVIHRAVPGSEEGISYDIGAFRRNGRTYLSLAGWARHISIYPIPRADAEFDRELASHKSGRGTLKFPLGEPLPLELIGKVAALLADQRAPGSAAPGNGKGGTRDDDA